MFQNKKLLWLAMRGSFKWVLRGLLLFIAQRFWRARVIQRWWDYGIAPDDVAYYLHLNTTGLAILVFFFAMAARKFFLIYRG